MEAGAQSYLTGYLPGSTTKANGPGDAIKLCLVPSFHKGGGYNSKYKAVKADFWEYKTKDKRNHWSNSIPEKA